jgi:hypothetical protein
MPAYETDNKSVSLPTAVIERVEELADKYDLAFSAVVSRLLAEHERVNIDLDELAQREAVRQTPSFNDENKSDNGGNSDGASVFDAG